VVVVVGVGACLMLEHSTLLHPVAHWVRMMAELNASDSTSL
jgi:hypothetical protein